MESEAALQKLQELRGLVDGEMEEMVDALARVVMLQQDIRSPMLGAKVTVYTRPSTEERVEVPAEEAPNPQSDEFNWQWMHFTRDGEDIYKFTPKKNPDDPDLLAHKAIVFEGNVGESAPEGDLWDTNEQEYKTADEYPVGTVNCIVAQDFHSDGASSLKDFEEDYPTDVEVYTSIVPVDGEPSPGEYTPGWPDKPTPCSASEL